MTKNEPKSLTEMTKEELLRKFVELGPTYPSERSQQLYSELRAELLRRMEAGEELVFLKEPNPLCPHVNQMLYAVPGVPGELRCALCELARVRQELAKNEAEDTRQHKLYIGWQDRAIVAEAEARRLREAVEQAKKAIIAAGHRTSCGFSACTCGSVETFKIESCEFWRQMQALTPATSEAGKALQPTPEGGTK